MLWEADALAADRNLVDEAINPRRLAAFADDHRRGTREKNRESVRGARGEARQISQRWNEVSWGCLECHPTPGRW